MNIKEYIAENFIIQYKTHLGLNSVKLRHSWFVNNNQMDILTEIFELTNFIEKATLSERIYCIMHNVTSIKNCPYCDNYVKYANYSEGYRHHCGNRKCNYLYKANFVHSNGLTSNQQGALNLKEKLKYVGEDGLTISKRNNKVSQSRMKSNIDSFGISQWDKYINIVKSENIRRKTTMTEFGITISELAAKKAVNTMQSTIADNGKTIMENKSEKMCNTKSMVDENGLDCYEKAFLNGAGKCSAYLYKGTNLYYQGSHELHFLNLMNSYDLIPYTSRGLRFKYQYENSIREYRSDFMFNNKIIIEIKSNWSYGKYEINKRIFNHVKFNSVLDNNMPLYVLFDMKWFLKITKEMILPNTNLYDYQMQNISNFPGELH